MAETTTLPATGELTARITVEDDAAPMARLLGRRLAESMRLGHAPEVLGRTVGTVVVRSHDTPQTGTIVFDGAHIAVSAGAAATPDATVVVDLHARLCAVDDFSGDPTVAAAALTALTPPTTHWRVAAERFWELTQGISGMPEVLVVQADGPNGPEHGRFGTGSIEYLLVGPADLLAGVFTGADDFLTALTAGVQVKGSLSQLSVMTAASWKVRFDV